MEYTGDLKSPAFGIAGSIPALRIMDRQQKLDAAFESVKSNPVMDAKWIRVDYFYDGPISGIVSVDDKEYYSHASDVDPPTYVVFDIPPNIDESRYARMCVEFKPIGWFEDAPMV